MIYLIIKKYYNINLFNNIKINLINKNIINYYNKDLMNYIKIKILL